MKKVLGKRNLGKIEKVLNDSGFSIDELRVLCSSASGKVSIMGYTPSGVQNFVYDLNRDVAILDSLEVSGCLS